MRFFSLVLERFFLLLFHFLVAVGSPKVFWLVFVNNGALLEKVGYLCTLMAFWLDFQVRQSLVSAVIAESPNPRSTWPCTPH